jgi:hypothetical protein
VGIQLVTRASAGEALIKMKLVSCAASTRDVLDQTLFGM